MSKGKQSFGHFIPEVAMRDGWYCHYCQTPIARRDQMILAGQGDDGETYLTLPSGYGAGTIDHKVPRSLGGKNNLENFVLCCTTCNSQKGNRLTYTEFKKLKSVAL